MKKWLVSISIILILASNICADSARQYINLTALSPNCGVNNANDTMSVGATTTVFWANQKSDVIFIYGGCTANSIIDFYDTNVLPGAGGVGTSKHVIRVEFVSGNLVLPRTPQYALHFDYGVLIGTTAATNTWLYLQRK